MRVELKRVYEQGESAAGYRVLVDRLWPRGLSKAQLPLDEWARELAPSAALRKWFGHDPARWEEFRRRYLGELEAQAGELERLRVIARRRPLILLYGAKDETRNQAVVLRAALLMRP